MAFSLFLCISSVWFVLVLRKVREVNWQDRVAIVLHKNQALLRCAIGISKDPSMTDNG